MTATDTQGPLPLPVNDICGIYYDLTGWEAYLRHLADRSPGYLHTFGRSLTHHAHADSAAYQQAVATDPHRAVDVLLEAGGLDIPVDDHVASLRRQGVQRQVLHGIGARLPGGGESVNERTAALAAHHPDHLVAWAGLDLRDPVQALIELKRCVLELGMRGASLVHWWADVGPRHHACHDIYALADELGIPLWVHTGMHFAADRPLTTCTWHDIDHIAAAHPSLTLIAGHGGWPWVLDAMAVLQRHPNVYIDISTNRGRRMAQAGSGWEPLLLYGRGLLREKVLFGSVSWVHTVAIRDLADEIAELPIGPAAARAWLSDNATTVIT
jgi:hypothetical protein